MINVFKVDFLGTVFYAKNTAELTDHINSILDGISENSLERVNITQIKMTLGEFNELPEFSGF